MKHFFYRQFIIIFLIVFFSIFGMIFVVRAEVCPTLTPQLTCTPAYVCGGTCVSTLPTCTGGKSLNCSTCNCECLSPNVVCDGSCVAAAANQGQQCGPDSSGRYGAYDACGVCANYQCPAAKPNLCNNQCQSAAPPGSKAGCAPGQDYDFCSGCTGPGSVILNPAAAQQGYISILGDFKSGSDLYLADGKAIRVDGSGATSLNIGNWGGGSLLLNLSGDFKTNAAALGGYNIDAAGIKLATPSLYTAKAWIGAGSPDPGVNGLSVSGNLISLGNITGVNVTGNQLCLGTDCKSSWPAGKVYTGVSNQIAVDNTANTIAFVTNPTISGDLTVNGTGTSSFAGQIKITGGSPNIGNVLTSDATGLASWQTPIWQASPFSTQDVILAGRRAIINSVGRQKFSTIYALDADGPVSGTMLCIGTDCRGAWPAGGGLGGSGTANYVPQFLSGGTSIGNSSIFADASGNIGIGTAAPSTKVEVRDDTASTAQLRITDYTQNPEIQLQYNSGANDHWGIYANKSLNRLTFWSGANRMTLTNTGVLYTNRVVANEFCFEYDTLDCKSSWPTSGGTGGSGTVTKIIAGNGLVTSTPQGDGFPISTTGTISLTPENFSGSAYDTRFVKKSGDIISSGVLEISGSGQLKIAAGAGTGKVLTSDANGLASWQTGTGTGTGTITGVTAGTWLTGGGLSGNVTLGLDTTNLLCSSDESIQSINSNGTVTCKSDERAGSLSETLLQGNNASGLNISYLGQLSIGDTIPQSGDKQLYLRTLFNSQNAEMDIASGDKPKWGIYHDAMGGTEELRFWNVDDRLIISKKGKLSIKEGDASDVVPPVTGDPDALLSIEDNKNYSFLSTTPSYIFSFERNSKTHLQIGANDALTRIDAPSGNMLALGSNGYNTLVIKNNGQVSIGFDINVPNFAFSVNGTIFADKVVTDNSASAKIVYRCPDTPGHGSTSGVLTTDSLFCIGTPTDTGLKVK